MKDTVGQKRKKTIKTKYSEKLGVAQFFHEGCDITIYRNGRVDVQGGTSEEEAIGFIND